MSDLIDRQAAIEAIREFAKKYTGFMEMEMYTDDDAVEAIEGLPPALPEITDEKAIKHLQSSGWMQNHDKQIYEMGLKEQLVDDSDSYDALLPSAQPQRKTGKWVGYDGDWLKTMCKCSECGAMIDINEKYRNFFCYHCGADMRGEQNER